MVRKILNRIRTIEIKWGKPQSLGTLDKSKYYRDEEGVYLISRIYNRDGELKEKFVYVGETRKGFSIRLSQHLDPKNKSEWTEERYGEFLIRFGHIDYPLNLIDKSNKEVEIKWLLLTIETTLIQYLKKDILNVQLKNKRQVKSWTIYYDLIIKSKNCFIVPCKMETRKLYRWEDIVETPDGILKAKGNLKTIHLD